MQSVDVKGLFCYAVQMYIAQQEDEYDRTPTLAEAKNVVKQMVERKTKVDPNVTSFIVREDSGITTKIELVKGSNGFIFEYVEEDTDTGIIIKRSELVLPVETFKSIAKKAMTL